MPLPELERILTEHGGAVGFVALLALRLGELIWGYFKNRDSKVDALKTALDSNLLAVRDVQKSLEDFRIDLRRAFFAIKTVSGDKWGSIAQELEDKFKKENNL